MLRLFREWSTPSKVWHSFIRKDGSSVMRYACSPTILCVPKCLTETHGPSRHWAANLPDCSPLMTMSHKTMRERACQLWTDDLWKRLGWLVGEMRTFDHDREQLDLVLCCCNAVDTCHFDEHIYRLGWAETARGVSPHFPRERASGA